MRIRLMALSHINNGVNRTQNAKYLQISRRMVNGERLGIPPSVWQIPMGVDHTVDFNAVNLHWLITKAILRQV